MRDNANGQDLTSEMRPGNGYLEQESALHNEHADWQLRA